VRGKNVRTPARGLSLLKRGTKLFCRGITNTQFYLIFISATLFPIPVENTAKGEIAT
jgi:hypothetical protein